MTRNGTNAEIRALAQQLIVHEESLRPASSVPQPGRPAVIERLLPSLIPLVGKTGACSLLARALTLAKRETLDLREVRVADDCTLEGLSGNDPGAVSILLTNLIGLLATFMGETLTLRLLRNAWPELPTLQRGAVEQSNHE